MQQLFRNVHAIGKKGRPFTDFAWMCEVKATVQGAPHEGFDANQSRWNPNINAVLRAKAKGFLNIGKDGGVLRFCCLLHDTIYQLSNLSKSLQRSVSTLAEAQSCLSSTQAVIEKYKSSETLSDSSQVRPSLTISGETLSDSSQVRPSLTISGETLSDSSQVRPSLTISDQILMAPLKKKSSEDM
ncbi:unnamed protein product [Leuciscus chuanchicus]